MRIEATACFTGYRPQKLPWGTDETDARCLALKSALAASVAAAYERGFRTFITGMAQGVDMFAAEAVLEFAIEHTDVELMCAIPFPGFAMKLKKPQKTRYERVILASARCFVCSDQYKPGCMMARNRFMVDNSSLVIAVYDGQSGGTHNTLNYAKEMGREVWLLPPEN